jgi:hypothetical protein
VARTEKRWVVGLSKPELRRLADLAEQELGARRLIEEAVGLEVGSLSLEGDMAAQAMALCEEHVTSYWDSEEEQYIDEEEAEELGLELEPEPGPELAEEEGQSRIFDPGV